MESQFFDFLNFHKEKPWNIIAPFRISKFRPFFHVFVLLGLLSWSSARVPPLLKALFNHHVIFLIGNAIIVMLFLLCRQNDAAAAGCDDDFFYDDYVSDPAAVTDLPPPVPVPVTVPKQIVVCEVEVDMAVTIEKARRQIKRLERSKSEKQKRELIMGTTTTTTLWRSETQNGRKSIESLSSEEFRRTIDSFIHQNWSTRKMNSKNLAATGLEMAF